MDIMTFSAFVSFLEGGRFNDDLTAALRALVTRMKRDHREGGGKPASKLSLTIGFRLEDGTIATTQSFAVDPPVGRSPDRFFVSPDGALTQRQPQAVIPIKGTVR